MSLKVTIFIIFSGLVLGSSFNVLHFASVSFNNYLFLNLSNKKFQTNVFTPKKKSTFLCFQKSNIFLKIKLEFKFVS